MKKLLVSSSTYALLVAVLLQITACKKDYFDPSRVKDDLAFNSARALTGVAVGLQRVYTYGRSSSLYNLVTANAFVTNEDSLLNPGNIPELQLFTGGTSVDATNTILSGLWTNSNKIIYDANRVISTAATLPDKGYASGLIAYSTIFKALSLGNMSMFWEQVPNGIGTIDSSVTFVDRMTGFNNAIASIDNALNVVAATPISASFYNNIPTGIDIMNTLYALKARYALFSGNNALALATAKLVDTTKRSTFNFDALTPNPIFQVTGSNNVYQPKDSTLGLPVAIQPNLADKRIPFYLSISADPLKPPRFRINGFGNATGTPYPIYLPGEITLIKAEAFTRLNQLDSGLAELNKVVTKKPANDVFGVGADLPKINGPLTQAALLTEIYRNRSIELFMSGLRLEDMRRFGRPLTERKRNFFPYPFIERDNNKNTPADPTI